MKSVLFFFMTLLPLLGYGQIITTVCGNGLPGSDGNGGLATLAKVYYPTLVTCDLFGNYYFTENSHKARMVSKCGIITTLAGVGTSGYSGDGGVATAAQLNMPLGIAVHKSGDIYINDRMNYRIRKVDALTGIITTVAGNGTPGFFGDSGPAILASINGVAGIACDTFGNLFISDHINNRIRKINNSGIISTYVGTGVGGYSGDGGLADTAKITLPSGIACDLSGNVFFIDGGCMGVRMVDRITGIISTVAGSGVTGFSGDGGPATLAKFYGPIAVTVDLNGNIYIADKGNERVRRVNTSGIVNTVAGTGTSGYSGDGDIATVANLYYPEGVACNKAGNLLIADFANHRIRKVTFNSDDTVSISISSVLSVPVGSIVTINATVANAGSSYIIHWLNRGVEFSTTTVPVVTYTKPSGIDTITARVVSTASYGCYDSVTSAPHYVSESSVNVAWLSQGVFSVFPNPGHNTLSISGEEVINSVTISNLVGEVLIKEQPEKEATQISIAHLPPGMYLLRVNDVYVQRFMKE
jgi:hypothetical protein